MPKLELAFNQAFAIVLNEIKENLTKNLTESLCLLTNNTLHAEINTDVIPNPQSLIEDIAKLLNGRPAVILNDEIQLFATHLTTVETNSCMPARVYEEYDKTKNHFGWKDFLIVAFYRALHPLAVIGRKHNILFCQAGTYNFSNISSYCPFKPIESFNSCLPLEPFDIDKCKTLFDHFWKFKITDEEKEDLLRQLLGPPKLMEYFFTELATIEKSPYKVSHEDLQQAVDSAIDILESTVRLRLRQVAGAYDTYVRMILYSEDYGGEVQNEVIAYKPETEGFRILREKGSSFSDSSVLRLHQGQEDSIIVEIPPRAIQLVMSHILFKKEQYNDLVAVLNNKTKLINRAKIRDIVKLHYHRFIGKPTPQQPSENLSRAATKSDMDPTEKAYSKLHELSKVMDPNFTQKLYDILADKRHAKRTPLLTLLNSSHSIEQLIVILERDF